ncbi:MAG TPA: hypothetical protein IAB06_07610 [Candidatus Avacidaminococcus intestinavium]|uniref:Putative zinc-ribbon domain-containing protein n=1 Tax=Candidatus Avacidaminococcus intestinavium TaxID=2840684 RepID=A0A9D1SLR1_9FIRM|nr:hypothetical protein [Candidatus Avacidaminococcus intestinavium]
MHCSFCGQIVQEGANFCTQCGNKIVVNNESYPDKCTVVCTEMGYKWSLFGKFSYRFQACRENGEVVMESGKMLLSGFEYDGPKETSKKYRNVFEKFVLKMEADGWRMGKERPKEWYNVTFYK